jgi:hypothetical protein
MGMATVIAMARHRLARVPYIGVPRAVVAARQRREAAQPYAPAPDHADYFASMASRSRRGTSRRERRGKSYIHAAARYGERRGGGVTERRDEGSG